MLGFLIKTNKLGQNQYIINNYKTIPQTSIVNSQPSRFITYRPLDTIHAY